MSILASRIWPIIPRHRIRTPPALLPRTQVRKMRIPYVPNPPVPATDADAAIVARIAARRAPRPLQPLDLALLHSPPVADGWNSFLGAVRTRTSLADDLRELAISRVAAVNRAWYEWGHHAPLAVAAGVGEAAMDAVRAEGALELSNRGEGMSEKQWAVVVYTDEMTRNVQVKDETFDVIKGLFSEREVVEITATVS
jgi:alkylhydroperoxidase family enzyme